MSAALDLLFDALVGASLAGAVVALIVWAAGATFGRLAAATRCALWWLVSLKLVVGLLWLAPVELPLLPPPATAPATLSVPAADHAAMSPVSTRTISATPSWRSVLVALWLVGLACAFAMLWRDIRRTARLTSRARPADGDVMTTARDLSARVGVASPDVRLSDEIDAPLVAGVMTPVIVLPAARWSSLTAEQQAMAICHELVHLGRGDLWLGLVPAVAERIFFFHPMAHLASREYVVARESACDAAVLRALDAAPRDYGRLLLSLGVAPCPGGLSASGAAHSFSSLKRRIVMLDHGSPTLAVRVAGWALALVAVAALVPLKLVARPAAPPAATPAAAPAQESAGRQTHTSGSRLEYTLVLGEKEGMIMSGNFDAGRAESERNGHDRVLWFRTGGKAYEVRDPAAIDQAAAIVRPMSQIGQQQGEIGSKQGAIGARQGLVGARQGEIGARQGAVGAQQGVLGARQGALGAKEARELSDAEKAEIEKEHELIDREMHELDTKMAALDVEMREAEKSMPDLSGEMDELSRQMDVLSRKMEEASAKADAEMQALAEKLIKAGIAKPIN